MLKAGRAALFTTLALLAACAAEPDDASMQAASVVRAFANICGRLDAAEITRRAGGLGFRAIDPDRLPPEARDRFPRDGSVQMMIRPSTVPGSVGAILAWNAQGPSCELAVGGVAPAAMEREFDRMVATLSKQPGMQALSGEIGGAPRVDGTGLVLRRAVFLVSNQQMGAAPQAVVLRTAEAPATDGRIQAIMSIHVARAQPAGATPPPAPAPR
jgi:hypothetical protein